MAINPQEHNILDWIKDLGGWIVAFVGFIFSLGTHFQVYQTHNKKIEALEKADDSTQDRLARIETKLDILLGDRNK